MKQSSTRFAARRDPVTLERGLEALESGPEFRGPVESLDGRRSNDHLALIYRDREEQLAAAIPFMRHGLERGERCMYIADENSEREVLAAMREAGVDVDAALESGALTIHTERDTYLRNGAFDPDDTISFIAEAIEGAREEFEALRITGEMTWVLGDGPRIEDLVEYEDKLNDLIPHEDCIALCQYNRERFPPEVLRDVVRTHPHLIYDDTVCHNFYYTPPKEFFGPERPDRELDRMMRTLLDRTNARTELQERERLQRALYEITASNELDFEEKVDRLLELGREKFGLEIGFLSRIGGGEFEVVNAVGTHELLQPGATAPLEETYCRRVLGSSGPTDVVDARSGGWEDDPAYEIYGLESYVGVSVVSGSDTYGTLCFASRTSRAEPFTDAEYTFLELMAQWLSDEIERNERERFLREQNEIAAAPGETFEEKLQSMFELGCERFDLELGVMARVDPESDHFEIEYASGEHEYFEPGFELPLSETYCTATADSDGSVGVSDPVGEGFEDVTVRRNFGLEAYLGIRIGVDGDFDRTFFFVSSEPRDREFTDDERTFHRLMGQWVKYELEHRGRQRDQRKLYEIAADTGRTFDEKLRTLFELGCERFGLELGGIARIDPATDFFEVEAVSGEHEHLVPGAQVSLSETYCRVMADADEAAITDPVDRGFGGTIAYEEFGVRAYLGTRIEVDGDFDRTFFFVSTEPHDNDFSDEERTFHHLMGQWVKYELERKKREDGLSALNALSRGLMDTKTAEEASELVVEAAAETLAMPVAAIGLYDEREGVIRRAARTDAAADLLREVSPFEVGEGIGWEAFVRGESRRDPDLAGDWAAGENVSVTDVIAVPLRKHGVLIVGSTACSGFSSAELDEIETVAATASAAIDRARREQQLQDRERTLEEQNEALERLDRINTIIRNIDKALVEASTRGEIEAVVCQRLAENGPYELAWIGDHDARDGGIEPREWAGAERGFLDQLAQTGCGADDGGPIGRAVRSREPQAVGNVLTDAASEPWRQAALNRGYHACLVLPLVYDDSLYGVLNVYAGQPGVFDELERAVLAELSDTIAYAINAVESKKALVSTKVTELKFRLDGGTELVEAAAELGCRLTAENVVPRADGHFRVFFSTRGVPVGDVLEVGRASTLDDVTLVTAREEGGEVVGLFEATIDDDNLCVAVLNHGGAIRELEVADGEGSLVVEIPSDADIREFVEMFRTKYPGSDLVSQRTQQQPRRNRSEFSALIAEELTPRQLEVFKTAYYSGFFEKPRPRNGSEIAESLGITQPTFNHHLRASQRKLCRLLFERGASTGD